MALKHRLINNIKLKIFFLSLLLVSNYSCSNKTPKIDMNIIENTIDKKELSSEKLPLRIAVGAMISPKTTQEYYYDLMTLIANKIGRKAVFVQKHTYAEVNDLVRNENVDLAYVCAGPYTVGKEKFGMEILVVPVVNGKAQYQCYIITHKDNPICEFGELRGKTFAFTDINSNTGYLVPKYLLGKMGETPEAFFKETFFSHSHDNSIKAVAQKQAYAASVDGLIWEFMDNIDPEFTSKTKIISTSEPYGIPPVVVLSSMDLNLKKNLQDAFININKEPRGRELLNKLNIDYFQAGADSSYNSVRDMQHWLEKNK